MTRYPYKGNFFFVRKGGNEDLDKLDKWVIEDALEMAGILGECCFVGVF